MQQNTVILNNEAYIIYIEKNQQTSEKDFFTESLGIRNEQSSINYITMNKSSDDEKLNNIIQQLQEKCNEFINDYYVIIKRN